MEGRHIVAIDLGTSKTALTVAEINGDDVQIVYYRKVPSTGIRYSYIFSPKKTADTVRLLVEDAEKELKIKIRRAVVGMPKYSVRQEAKSGRVERNLEECISEDEINDMKRMAMDSYPLDHPESEELFGAVAQSFSNGDEIGLAENDIIGVSGEILEGNFKLFIGKKKNLRDIDITFKGLGIDVVQKYFTAETTAKAVLRNSEMENGVALVDLGAGVTSVSVYYRNIMRHYAAIPFGGNSLTSDIKTESGITEELAENIKKAFGGCMPDKLQNLSEKTLHISSGSAEANVQIPVKYLSELITARMKEIIEAVLYEIQQSGFADNLRSGIVITGGGAKLLNCANYIKELSGYEVRTGGSRNFFSAAGYENIYDYDAAISAGMIMKAKADRVPDCTAADTENPGDIPIEIENAGTGPEAAEKTDAQDAEDTVFNPKPEQTKQKNKNEKGNKTNSTDKRTDSKPPIIQWFGTLFESIGNESV